MSFCQANVDLCLFALLPYGSIQKGVEGRSVKFLFDILRKGTFSNLDYWPLIVVKYI